MERQRMASGVITLTEAHECRRLLGEALDSLDAVKFRIAAAHVDMAIHAFEAEYLEAIGQSGGFDETEMPQAGAG